MQGLKIFNSLKLKSSFTRSLNDSLSQWVLRSIFQGGCQSKHFYFVADDICYHRFPFRQSPGLIKDKSLNFLDFL
ncbi:Uncharacterised protein [Mycobacterium tuberculosis]|nr:Uncharacterised protein [Mycobacterium tuberculosis]